MWYFWPTYLVAYQAIRWYKISKKLCTFFDKGYTCEHEPLKCQENARNFFRMLSLMVVSNCLPLNPVFFDLVYLSIIFVHKNENFKPEKQSWRSMTVLNFKRCKLSTWKPSPLTYSFFQYCFVKNPFSTNCETFRLPSSFP